MAANATQRREPGMELYDEWRALERARCYKPVKPPVVQALFNDFPYEKIPPTHVRLLRIEPDDDEAPIRCSMSSHDYDNDRPSYVAVSYSWGAKYSKTIILNDVEITIGDNCWHALWQLRHNGAKRWCWIDALCINQRDLTEKTEQISRMGVLYQFASFVIACVGPHANESAYLIEQLQDFVQEWQTYFVPKWQHRGSLADFTYYIRDKLSPPLIPDDFVRFASAVCRMAERPYWNRAWVVQELYINRDAVLMVGDSLIRLEYFATVVDILNFVRLWEKDKSPLQAGVFDAIPTGTEFLDSTSEERQASSPLELLVSKYANTYCTNILDHVYAFLHLAVVEEGKQPIKIDYTISKFDLLLKIVDNWSKKQAGNWNPLERMENILRVLQIDAKHEVIRSWVEKREVQHDFSFLKNYTSWQQDYRAVPISLDAWDRLSIPLEFEKPIDALQNSFRELFDAELHGVNDRSVPIYSGSTIVALACKDTKPGDVLLIWDKLRMYPDIGIIARRYDDHIFSIVGQAVINQGLQEQWVEMYKHYLDCMTYNLVFSKEDIITFVAQGLSLPSREKADKRVLSWDTTTVDEIKLHFDRLGTLITGQPGSSFVYRQRQSTSVGQQKRVDDAARRRDMNYEAHRENERIRAMKQTKRRSLLPGLFGRPRHDTRLSDTAWSEAKKHKRFSAAISTAYRSGL